MRVEQIGAATLYLGDCREVLPGLGRVAGALMDPPYGTQGLGGGYGRRQLHDKGDGNGRTIANDHDLSAYAEALPLVAGAVKCGWIAAFYTDRRTPEFVEASKCPGVAWFGGVVWDKAQPGLGYHIRYAHESIGVFRVGEAERPKDPLISVVRGSVSASAHPHEKPIQALAPLVRWIAPGGGASGA